MILVEKNWGTFIRYRLTGSTLSLRDEELILDLAHYERDFPVHIDISENSLGRLVLGPSRRYLAEVDIPARQYRVEQGVKDDLGFPKLSKNAVTFDPQKVTLTVWALEV